MKSRYLFTTRLLLAVALGAGLFGTATVRAVDGTWNANSDGWWIDTTKWVSGTYATGTNSIATFGDFINANRTVQLNQDITVGTINFWDTSNDYTISTINGGMLTLAVTSGTPVINVASAVRTNTISAQILGTNGLTKTGTGVLSLSYNGNRLTGNTVISNGKVLLGAQYALWMSAYDTTGSTGAIGLNVGSQTAPVLGGLAGNVDLATAITGYGSVAQLRLNPLAGYTNTYSGVIANGAANMRLLKTGPGVQILTGANTYSGVTTNFAGKLVLGGASGSALNSAFVVLGGTLELDNSGGTWINRLADGTALSLGSLTLTSFNGAGVTNETIGATTFATSGKVTINNGTTGGDETTLAMGAVTRNAGVAIDFVGTGTGTFGGGSGSPNVTSTGAFPGMSNGILPWGTVGGTQWAENNANSIRAYSGVFVDPTAVTSAATSNAQFTGTGTMSTAKSFNSLNVIANGAGQRFTLGNTLTLTSGAILKSGTDAYTITNVTGNITAGAELRAHVDGGTLTISSPLNTAIVGLAKGGTGTLVLSGTRAGTWSGAISLNGQLEFMGNTTTITGAISGSGGITVNLNAGQRLVFVGRNKNYSGTTLVKSGILQLGLGWDNQSWSTIGTVGKGDADYSSNHQLGLSNLELNGGSATIYYYSTFFLGSGPGQFQITGGTSGFTFGGGGGFDNTSLTINGDAGYEVVWGSPYFNPTELLLGASSTAGSSFNIPNKIDLNGTTRTIRTDNATWRGRLAGVIRNSTGTAGITKTGVGELNLPAANTFNGVTTISEGILSLSEASGLALQNSALDTANSVAGTASAGLKTTVTTMTLGGLIGDKDFAAVFTTTSGGFSNVTALTLNPAASVTRSYSGVITNGAAGMTLTKTGLGTQILSGANTYTGATIIRRGVLEVTILADGGVASGIGQSANTAASLVFSNSTLRYTGSSNASTDRRFTIAAGVGTAGTFDASGSGTATLTWSGSPTYTTINQARVINLVGSQTGDNVFAGNISSNGSGVVSVNKSGGGTWVLAGENSYGGATTISGGTLKINGTMVNVGPGAGTITVASGGTLGGTGTVNRTVNINDNGTLSPGNSIGTLTVNGLLTLGTDAKLNWELGSVGNSDKVVAQDFNLVTLGLSQFTWNTNAGFGNGTYTLFEWTGSNQANWTGTDTNGTFFTDYTFTLWQGTTEGDDNYGDLMLTVIPEPSALTLVGMGLLGAVMLRRFARRRA